MIYYVYNDNNVEVKIRDEDIEAAINGKKELKREIIQAMGKTKNKKYLKYLFPFLEHDFLYVRLDAAHSIFNLDEKAGLSELKKRADKIDISDFEKEPSEKAVLCAMIIKIQKGVEGIKEYFLSEDGYLSIKYCLLDFYQSGYEFSEEDIKLICFVLDKFIEKKCEWINKFSKEEYNEFIYFALESIWIAGLEKDILRNLDDDLKKELLNLTCKLLNKKVSTEIKEVLAEITKFLDESYAKQMLYLLKDNVKGDAKKVYLEAIKLWKIED